MRLFKYATIAAAVVIACTPSGTPTPTACRNGSYSMPELEFIELWATTLESGNTIYTRKGVDNVGNPAVEMCTNGSLTTYLNDSRQESHAAEAGIEYALYTGQFQLNGQPTVCRIGFRKSPRVAELSQQIFQEFEPNRQVQKNLLYELVRHDFVPQCLPERMAKATQSI